MPNHRFPIMPTSGKWFELFSILRKRINRSARFQKDANASEIRRHRTETRTETRQGHCGIRSGSARPKAFRCPGSKEPGHFVVCILRPDRPCSNRCEEVIFRRWPMRRDWAPRQRRPVAQLDLGRRCPRACSEPGPEDNVQHPLRPAFECSYNIYKLNK